MKTISSRFLLFMALATLFTACQENPKKESQEMEAQEITYEAPKQIISLVEADSLYVNYKKRRARIIEQMETESHPDGKPFVPTQFVSFDINVLKEYIGYVEQEAKKGGTTADSLRIYFGNYGNTSKKYPKKNTVFLLPTATVNKDYGGIFIDSEGKAKLIRDWVNEQLDEGLKGNQRSEASILPSFSSTSSLQGGKSLTLNFGQGGPPPKTDF
ncbi:hypothetical protein [Maribacter sp. 4G9]|uniref:hypothetical protein n=1 Tax=Maribacter sp. 4G9 TaxID=1889777 RepID=UPI000C440226|nr:hypothetical protein [Maribacter sp. 4G9]PIB30545.1 hypothetical protein BFP75_02070 [Maribacter sp. 4G9]